MSGVLDHSLVDLWTASYTSNQSAFKLKIEETRHRPVLPYHILYNSSAPSTPSTISHTTFSNFDDSQSKLADESRVICWVDFDNEEISKEKPSEESKEICDEEVTDSYHPLYINPVPWVNGQCFLALFPEECLPQAVSTELLTLAMNIFRLSKNPNLRLGYDSLGANSDVNHLHFHVMFSDSFGGLPVEKAQRKLLIESSLQHKNSEEINMFSMGIRLFEVSYPAKCLLICPSVEVNESNVSDGTESVGNVTGMLVNNLIENNVPHSLMIVGDKLEVYVFPRNFQQDFSVGKGSFLDLSGVVCTHNEEFFNASSAEQCGRYIESLSADNATWNKATSYITQLLAKLYN
jgi:hypothetical protein